MSARCVCLALLCLALAAAPAAASRFGLAGLGLDVCETYSSEECREHLDKCTPCRVCYCCSFLGGLHAWRGCGAVVECCPSGFRQTPS